MRQAWVGPVTGVGARVIFPCATTTSNGPARPRVREISIALNTAAFVCNLLSRRTSAESQTTTMATLREGLRAFSLSGRNNISYNKLWQYILKEGDRWEDLKIDKKLRGLSPRANYTADCRRT
jgi:hypothetical protein